MVKEHQFKLKVTTRIALAPNKSQLVLWSFEAKHWLVLSSCERTRWHLLPVEGCFVYMENLLFSRATCYFTLHFYVETAPFFKLLLPPNFSLAVSSILSAVTELRIKALIWIRLWVKGMLWLVWTSIQTIKTFSTFAIRKLCFLITHVFTFNFLQELFLCIQNLDVWWKRSSYQLLTCLPH